MSDAALTGATVPVIIEGVEYQFSPLTDRDFVELDEWVRQRMMRTALDALQGVKDKALRAEVIEQATQTAASGAWVSGPGARIMGTVDGVSRLFWQSIKKKHPNVTHADLRQMMFTGENVQMVIATFNRLNRFKFATGAAKKGSQAKTPEAPPTTESSSTND